MMQESGALMEITPEVREAVRRSADTGLRATPSRVETGGILTGTIHEGRLLINAAEQIRCDHKYGAAYQLSPEECDQMRAAAEAIRSSRTRQIAGYFRSSNETRRVHGPRRRTSSWFQACLAPLSLRAAVLRSHGGSV
jgi:hypothetical protein